MFVPADAGLHLLYSCLQETTPQIPRASKTGGTGSRTVIHRPVGERVDQWVPRRGRGRVWAARSRPPGRWVSTTSTRPEPNGLSRVEIGGSGPVLIIFSRKRSTWWAWSLSSISHMFTGPLLSVAVVYFCRSVAEAGGLGRRIFKGLDSLEIWYFCQRWMALATSGSRESLGSFLELSIVGRYVRVRIISDSILLVDATCWTRSAIVFREPTDVPSTLDNRYGSDNTATKTAPQTGLLRDETVIFRCLFGYRDNVTTHLVPEFLGITLRKTTLTDLRFLSTISTQYRKRT